MKKALGFLYFLPVVLIAASLYAQSLGDGGGYGVQEGSSPAGPVGPALRITDGAAGNMYLCGASNVFGFNNSNSPCTPGDGGTILFSAMSAKESAGVIRVNINGPSNGVLLASSTEIAWSSTSAASGSQDTGLIRAGVGLLQVTDGASGPGLVYLKETTTPAAAAADFAKIYAKDNGSGKTQLCAIFSSGAEQCFATQP